MEDMKDDPLNLKAVTKDQRELNARRSKSITLHAADRRYCLSHYLQ
jgi:hypothetical protein